MFKQNMRQVMKKKITLSISKSFSLSYSRKAGNYDLNNIPNIKTSSMQIFSSSRYIMMYCKRHIFVTFRKYPLSSEDIHPLSYHVIPLLPNTVKILESFFSKTIHTPS